MMTTIVFSLSFCPTFGFSRILSEYIFLLLFHLLMFKKGAVIFDSPSQVHFYLLAILYLYFFFT